MFQQPGTSMISTMKFTLSFVTVFLLISTLLVSPERLISVVDKNLDTKTANDHGTTSSFFPNHHRDPYIIQNHHHDRPLHVRFFFHHSNSRTKNYYSNNRAEEEGEEDKHGITAGRMMTVGKEEFGYDLKVIHYDESNGVQEEEVMMASDIRHFVDVATITPSSTATSRKMSVSNVAVDAMIVALPPSILAVEEAITEAEEVGIPVFFFGMHDDDYLEDPSYHHSNNNEKDEEETKNGRHSDDDLDISHLRVVLSRVQDYFAGYTAGQKFLHEEEYEGSRQATRNKNQGPLLFINDSKKGYKGLGSGSGSSSTTTADHGSYLIKGFSNALSLYHDDDMNDITSGITGPGMKEVILDGGLSTSEVSERLNEVFNDCPTVYRDIILLESYRYEEMITLLQQVIQKHDACYKDVKFSSSLSLSVPATGRGGEQLQQEETTSHTMFHIIPMRSVLFPEKRNSSKEDDDAGTSNTWIISKYSQTERNDNAYDDDVDDDTSIDPERQMKIIGVLFVSLGSMFIIGLAVLMFVACAAAENADSSTSKARPPSCHCTSTSTDSSDSTCENNVGDHERV